MALAALLAFPLAIVAAHAQGQDRPKYFALDWAMVGTNAPTQPVEVQKGKSVPYMTISPRRLFGLSEPVLDQDGKQLIPAGGVLGWAVNHEGIACEPTHQQFTSYFICLEDTDGDQRFDGYIKILASVFTYGAHTYHKYMMGVFPVYSRGGISKAVSAPPEMSVPSVKVDVDFYYAGQRTLAQGINVAFCVMVNDGKNIWGGPIREKYCQPSTSVPDASTTVPGMGGGSVTILSRAKKSITVSINPPQDSVLYQPRAGQE